MSGVDRMTQMWEQQRRFMDLLREKRGFPSFPVNLETKEGQKFLKGIAHECMSELFEAIQELKNSKAHRQTNVNQFNRVAYIEELTDTMHYFLEIVITSGITKEEFFEAYMEKGRINEKRILDGY